MRTAADSLTDQCDQQKPHCLKCQKSGKSCPGYRNLNEILFRDESERILRKNAAVSVRRNEIQRSSTGLSCYTVKSTTSVRDEGLQHLSIPNQLCQATSELAATFFFTKYAHDDPRMPNEFQKWMYRSYFHEDQNQMLLVSPVLQTFSMLLPLHWSPNTGTAQL